VIIIRSAIPLTILILNGAAASILDQLPVYPLPVWKLLSSTKFTNILLPRMGYWVWNRRAVSFPGFS